jgi:hypothetical protein
MIFEVGDLRFEVRKRKFKTKKLWAGWGWLDQ